MYFCARIPFFKGCLCTCVKNKSYSNLNQHSLNGSIIMFVNFQLETQKFHLLSTNGTHNAQKVAIYNLTLTVRQPLILQEGLCWFVSSSLVPLEESIAANQNVVDLSHQKHFHPCRCDVFKDKNSTIHLAPAAWLFFQPRW